ncbi:T. brucei spp.-specific protein [Trypanosoma brucei gambiense DAL972]|uniref:T. brucei spp.-specific protein n=1 Tax=Trypanosoma brucei gambiense (strain MHOM/CI/86/DAL972) TaxID=679716 RepID=C9ZVK6_TRYB9|nr:T. brucei spp.-specific protein [Trypanosoma brucei gambiense DAL972]CBH13444.1 T. brucei spp.-specific protein [Trypanosoma brucei gambiense DAL972]|eukprot:XP_011775721.1 T. brucei spp.-specific protein [Trypanosoma brucei gambiense DAL972]
MQKHGFVNHCSNLAFYRPISVITDLHARLNIIIIIMQNLHNNSAEQKKKEAWIALLNSKMSTHMCKTIFLFACVCHMSLYSLLSVIFSFFHLHGRRGCGKLSCTSLVVLACKGRHRKLEVGTLAKPKGKLIYRDFLQRVGAQRKTTDILP